MTTIKEQIFNFVKNQTKDIIIAESYDFEDLNATTISIDLNIDRSNVSRILNTLHKEKKLIKQKGRPTLFFSHEIFIKEYPFLSLPLTLEIGDDIKNYVNISNYNLKPQLKNHSFDFSYSNSFYSNFQKIFPIFLLPTYELRTILITGEIGSGKTFLLEKTFDHAKKAGIINFNSSILYYKNVDTNLSDTSILSFLKEHTDNSISALSLEFENCSPKLVLQYTRLIDTFYKNINEETPIIIFNIFNSEDFEEYQNITSYNLHVPSFNSLSYQEKIHIVLEILYVESVRLVKNISVSKKTLLKIISKEYKYNIQELKINLFHQISLKVFNQSNKLNQIFIDDYLDSIPITNNIKNQDVWLNLPEIIMISPEDKSNIYNTLDNHKVTTNSNNIINITELLTSFTSSDTYMTHKSKLADKISNVLFDTPLMHDISLIYNLSKIINQISQKEFDVKKYENNIMPPKNFSSHISYRRILRLINPFDISEKEKLFIESLLYASFQLTSETKIPVLILSNSFENDYNYAMYFNKFTQKRLFYTLDKTSSFYNKNSDVETKVEIISKFTQKINRGNGILLVNNLNSNEELYKKLLLELRNQAFLINSPSVELMTSILDLKDKMKRNIFSLSPILIRTRKENRFYFSSQTLTDSNERSIKFIQPFKEIFDSTYIKQTTEEFYNTLNELAFNFNFPLNNDIIFDFLFVGNAIINNRNIDCRHNDTSRSSDFIIKRPDIYTILSNKINDNPFLAKFALKDYEIFGLYQTIENYTVEQ